MLSDISVFIRSGWMKYNQIFKGAQGRKNHQKMNFAFFADYLILDISKYYATNRIEKLALVLDLQHFISISV